MKIEITGQTFGISHVVRDHLLRLFTVLPGDHAGAPHCIDVDAPFAVAGDRSMSTPPSS